MRDFASGFLHRLAARHRFRRLAVVDDAGDDLDEPRRERTGQCRLEAGDERPHPKLLDEDEQVAVGIVQHHAGGVAPLEDLALERRPPAAVVEAVAQPVAIDAEITGVGFLPAGHFHVVGRHGGRPGLFGHRRDVFRISLISSSSTSWRGGAGGAPSTPA